MPTVIKTDSIETNCLRVFFPANTEPAYDRTDTANAFIALYRLPSTRTGGGLGDFRK